MDDEASGEDDFALPAVFTPMSRQDQMAAEKELLGLYLSDHPLDQFADRLKGIVTHNLEEARSAPDRTQVKIAGVLTGVRPYYTKTKNEQMYFLTLEDKTGSIAVTLFPRGAAEYGSACVKDSVVVVEGKVSYRERINTTAPASGEGGGGISAEVSAEKVLPIASAEAVYGSSSNGSDDEAGPEFEQLHIRISPLQRDRLRTLYSILDNHKGSANVYLHVSEKGKKQVVLTPIKIAPETKVVDYIRSIMGSSEEIWVK
jgi:DNA polymerase-3 subunit alpha